MEFKISFCTTCRNRLSDLKQTLPRNIEANDDYPNLEFVILDYNSTDGLSEWIKKEMSSYLSSGRISYFRTTEPDEFHMAHAKNMALKLASGDILCNIDADNFAGLGFAKYVNDMFTANDGIFLACNTSQSLFGKNCVLRKDFLKVTGYDESMKGYGNEDLDFYKRLLRTGLRKIDITAEPFLHYLENTDLQKVVNTKSYANLKYVLYRWISPSSSEVCLLQKDFTYVSYRIKPINKISISFPTFTDQTKGLWAQKSLNIDSIHLTLDHQDLVALVTADKFLPAEHWFVLNNEEFIARIIKQISIASNLDKMRKNTDNNLIKVNSGFGNGKVKRNFKAFSEN